MKYHKVFIMLQEEDKGFGKGGKATGYFKLEQREHKIKAMVHVQNIGLSGEGKVLKAYLLTSRYPHIKPILLGTINYKGEAGELSCDLGIQDLQNVSVSDLDTVIVICKDTVIQSNKITFPLVGYRQKPWDWKQIFLKHIDYNLVKKEDEQQLDKIQEKSTLELDTKRKEIQTVFDPKQKRQESEKQAENISSELKDEKVQEEDVEVLNIELEKETETVQELEQVKEAELEKEVECEEGKEKEERSEEESKENASEEKEKPTLMQYPEDVNTRKKDRIQQESLDVEQQEIFMELSKYIKREEPLLVGDKGYKWWMINDCRFILNNSYSNYSVSSMFYNPWVINTVHRYGHYLFGVKMEDQEVTDICYAFPGRFGTEPHPLLYAQPFAYWYPSKGEQYKVGAFGYWTVGINLKKGEIVAV